MAEHMTINSVRNPWRLQEIITWQRRGRKCI